MLFLLMIFLPMAAAPVGWMIGRRSKRGRDALAIGVGFVELALALAAYFLRSSAGADLTAELGGICGLGLRLKYDGFRAVYCLVLSFMWADPALFSRLFRPSPQPQPILFLPAPDPRRNDGRLPVHRSLYGLRLL